MTSSGNRQTSGILLREDFEDSNLARRGWYDLPDGALTAFSSAEHAPGRGTRSWQAHFPLRATTPVPRMGGRFLFPASTSVYLRYWVKYSDNWVGSGKPYHPHEFLLMTNADSEYVGPSYTHLTAYVEHNYQTGGVAMPGGFAILGMQDGRNVDVSRVGTNLAPISEQRAVAGCNGGGDCFQAEGQYHNSTVWRSSVPAFPPVRLGLHSQWHTVEAYFQLNTLQGGRARPDGIAWYKVDGRTLIERTDVVFRTGALPDLKFQQLMLAPYMGDGSPVDQSAWYDDILVLSAPPP